jgi:hypothetical protein
VHGSSYAISSGVFSTILSRFRQLWLQDASEVCTQIPRNQGNRSGYSLVWNQRSLRAARGKSACADSAPIGAQVFKFERRNHSKTGVYEDLCRRVPVDTTTAVDKLEKAKKGFKFERFNVLFQLTGSSWGRQGSKHRIGREAARMGGLPFDSASPNRSLQSQLKTLQIASGPASSAMDSLSGATVRSRLRNAEPAGIPTFLRRSPAGPQVWFAPLIRDPQFSGKLGCNLPGPESKDSGVLFQCRKWTRSLTGPTSTASSAAQPLHYEQGEGWDDCSFPQEPAGRGNEETA